MMQLPDTLAEVNAQYYVSQLVEKWEYSGQDEPTTVDEVCKGVLSNLIHVCALWVVKPRLTVRANLDYSSYYMLQTLTHTNLNLLILV